MFDWRVVPPAQDEVNAMYMLNDEAFVRTRLQALPRRPVWSIGAESLNKRGYLKDVTFYRCVYTKGAGGGQGEGFRPVEDQPMVAVSPMLWSMFVRSRKLNVYSVVGLASIKAPWDYRQRPATGKEKGAFKPRKGKGKTSLQTRETSRTPRHYERWSQVALGVDGLRAALLVDGKDIRKGYTKDIMVEVSVE